MSHFTLNVDPRGGPILNVVLGASEARIAALTAANVPVPNPVPIRGLLDTGASGTCIDPAILVGNLGLTPRGQIDAFTPSTGTTPHKADLYDVSLRILAATSNDPQLYHGTIPVMASDLFAAQGIHALIGRDVLAGCLLVYNGATGLFTLAF